MSTMLLTPKRAATYRRVSTEEQVSNHSLGNQSDKLVAFAQQQGYTIVREYVDPGYSGTARKRPGLEQLLQDAQAGLFDTVLIYRLDRLARSTHLAYTLIQELVDVGVGVRSYSEPQIDSTTPMGKVSLGVTAIFAELERDTFMQRSRDGMKKAVESGLHAGGNLAYGYVRKDKRLVICEVEAEIVRMIFGWSVERRWTNGRIAEELNTLGITTRYRRTGKQRRGEATLGHWAASSVYSIMKNRIYTGEYRFCKNRNDGEGIVTVVVPALVTVEVWEGAQEVMRMHRSTAMRNAKRIYMLRGLMRCAVCGRRYTGRCGDNWYNYSCGGRALRSARPGVHSCTNRPVKAKIEGELWARIVEIISAPDMVIAQQPLTLVPAELPLVEKALAEAQAGRERLMDLYLDPQGGLSKEGYLKRLGVIDAQIGGLESRLSLLRDTQAQQLQRDKVNAGVVALAAQYRDQLEQADETLRQTLANHLIRGIVVQADGSLDVDWVV